MLAPLLQRALYLSQHRRSAQRPEAAEVERRSSRRDSLAVARPERRRDAAEEERVNLDPDAREEADISQEDYEHIEVVKDPLPHRKPPVVVAEVGGEMELRDEELRGDRIVPLNRDDELRFDERVHADRLDRQQRDY